MRKGAIIGLILIVALISVSTVYAVGPWGGHQHEMGYSASVDIDAVKKFQKETLPLRDELITKRLELQKEYAKDTPDKAHIATLRKEIIDIELKIQEKADAAGISNRGCGMMGQGTMGHGMMMGRGMMGTECPCQM